MWWGEYTGKTSVAKRVREKVEQCGDSVRQADWSEDARAEEWVSAEGIKKRVFGAGNV
jgi:hypothetical protein